jgi:hypothetical protein
MTILAIFNGVGITADMYQALRKEVGWETRHADGGVFHAAAVDESGNMHVADVWESPEVLQAFVNDRLMPAMDKLGVPAPAVSVYPTININALPAVERFMLR